MLGKKAGLGFACIPPTLSLALEESEEPLMKHEDHIPACEDMALPEHQIPNRMLHRLGGKVFGATQSIVAALGYIVVPSFAQSDDPHSMRKESSTEFMNGLKGFASSVVYIGHFITPLYPHLLEGYGQHTTSMVWQLPFVRIFYSGTAMVALFFVISGFVLSKTAIDHIQKGRHEQASKALAASIFKRAFRLYPAPIVSTFLVMLACKVGLYDDPVSPRLETKRPIRLATWNQQLKDWVSFVVGFLFNPWQWFPKNPESNYGGHLWTISISFTCSVFLFVGILGLSRLGKRQFILVASLLVVYNLLVRREPLALFYFGMLLAYVSSRDHVEVHIGLVSRRNKLLRHVLPTLLVVFGLYLGSYPVNGAGQAPGYLNSLIILSPLSYFAIGAMAVVGGLLHQPFLQRPLCSNVALYLGKISFSYYIVHEPLLQIFGWRCFLAIEEGPELRDQTIFIRYVALSLVWLLITAAIILIADLFWRFVEVPSTTFANSLKTRLFQNSSYIS